MKQSGTELHIRTRILSALTLVVLRIAVAIPAAAVPDGATQPGDLDPTFGTGGKVTRDFFGNRDEARAIEVLPHGKILVAGYARSGTDQGPDSAHEDFALERYKSNGTLDATFGAAGDVLTDFGAQERAGAMVIQPDGKIVVAGATCTGENFDICDFALARYTSDGALDNSFGSGGRVTTHFPGFVTLAQGLALQSDGKIVATGWAFDETTFAVDFALARYRPDGTLDPSFGDGGLVTTDFGAGDDFNLTVVIQATGKIVAAGGAFSGTTFDFALARYNPDGALDLTFGVGGKVLTDFGSGEEEIRDLTLEKDGRMVAVGETFYGSEVAFALARYNRNGTLDTGFGNGGLVTTNFGSGDAQGEGVVIQPDGKILAAGGGVFADLDFQLARYNRNGTLDVSFGDGGIVTTDFFGGNDRANAVALSPDGRIVLAGHAFNGVSRDFALARYLSR